VQELEWIEMNCEKEKSLAEIEKIKTFEEKRLKREESR
jgi:hypothetical protein